MRLRFMFWLDLNKEDELMLSENIRELKQERSFVRVIRDGLRLMSDLRNGRTTVLRELFPWVLEQHDLDKLQAPTATVSAVEEVISEYMLRLESLMKGQAGGAAGTLALGTSRLPQLSDGANSQWLQDEIEIKQAQVSADDKPTWNFMISSALSVYGHCTFLPANIREYGIRTGRIPPNALPAPPKKSGNAKKMAVPELKPPEFDEDSLENLLL